MRLGLGPTNPGTITVALETLLLRPTGFSPVLRLLIPAFSLDTAPPYFTIRLHRNINAPLPLFNLNTRLFGCSSDFLSSIASEPYLSYGERGAQRKIRNAPNRQCSD